MEKIALDRLALVDLYGKPVNLREHFKQHLLLIFLRHLA